MQYKSFSAGVASALKIGMNGESISDCALNYGNKISDTDPRDIKVETVCDDEFLMYIISTASRAPQINDCLDRNDNLCIFDSIFNYLNSRHLQFNSRRAFEEYLPWQEVIKNRIYKKEKLHIIIPIFCNIGNPLKRFHETTLTAAEKVTLKFLNEISEKVRNNYAQCLCFDVVVDANFYSMPFMNSVVETNSYFRELKNYVESEKLSDNIRIIDMMDLLSNKSECFLESYNKWLHQLSLNKSNDYNENRVNSMLHCINIRHLTEDYQSIISCYSKNKTDFGAYMWDTACKSLSIYISLKNAAADINWEDIIGEDFVRATIHTKDIPVLGLRIYPEYKKSSRLLPYHGIAYFSRKTDAHPIRMQIIPEMEAVTLNNVVRIRNEDGITQAYINNYHKEKYLYSIVNNGKL